MFLTLAMIAIQEKAAASAPVAPSVERGKIVAASMFKNGYVFVTREIDVNAKGETDIVPPQGSLGTIWFLQPAGGLKVERVSTVPRPQEVTNQFTDTYQVLNNNVGKSLQLTLKEDDILGEMVTGTLEQMIQQTAVFRVGTTQHLIDLSRIRYVACQNGSLNLSTKATYNIEGMRLFTSGGAGKVRYVSLEHGMTWAPGYAISLDDEKHLSITAKATIYAAGDKLAGASIKLITGFPNIPFAGYPDSISTPMAVYMEMISRLDINNPTPIPWNGTNLLFSGGGVGGFASNSNGTFFNQSARPGGGPGAQTGGFGGQSAGAGRRASDMPVTAPAVTAGEPAVAETSGDPIEDLYFYNQSGVELEPNQRGMFTMFTGKCDYERVFTSEITDQDAFNESESDRFVDVWQAIRFKNMTGKPFTTAVATMMENGELLGQSSMKHTAPGGTAAMKLSKALSVHLEAREGETSRDRGVIKSKPSDKKLLPQDLYDRATMSGTISVTNPKEVPIKVRITRPIQGEEADKDGAEFTTGAKQMSEMNRHGKLEWTRTLKPGETLSLKYSYKMLVRSIAKGD